jgi:DNA-binding NtrC family response regulator
MSHHILCIDDNRNFLCNLKASLDAKYQVSIATSFKEATQVLNQNPVDLVFLDVNLGAAKNGISNISQIKEIDPSVVIIMLSGYKNPNLIVDAIKEGASDYLYKPYPHEDLISVIERNLTKKQVIDRNEALVEHYNEPIKGVQIIGQSPAMQDLLEKAKKMTGHFASILIEGESGTGKEVLARYIYSLEENPKRPFIVVNCAAIPSGLIESELFGHEKGAFTGACQRKIGKFELANGGDLFLDEVNSLTPDFQAKLLRVLQEREFFRVGGNQSIKVQVRVISATNRDLYQEYLKGNFREDLLYRLRVIKFTIPPLRARMEDVKPLLHHFLKKYSGPGAKKQISADVLQRFQSYPWQGNIRELENIIQSLLILAKEDEIKLTDLPDWIQNNVALPCQTHQHKSTALVYQKIDQSLKEFLSHQEKSFIHNVLKQNDGNLTKTARVLKISRTTLYKRMGREMLIDFN